MKFMCNFFRSTVSTSTFLLVCRRNTVCTILEHTSTLMLFSFSVLIYIHGNEIASTWHWSAQLLFAKVMPVGFWCCWYVRLSRHTDGCTWDRSWAFYTCNPGSWPRFHGAIIASGVDKCELWWSHLEGSCRCGLWCTYWSEGSEVTSDNQRVGRFSM